MGKALFSAALLIAITAPRRVHAEQEANTSAAGSPVRCETDVTATTPAPDVVEDAADVVQDAGEAVKDAGEAVADTVSDAVNDLTK